MAQDPKWFMPQQFKNLANTAIHFSTAGPEIWNDTEGKVAGFVVGIIAGTRGPLGPRSDHALTGRGLSSCR